MHSWTLMQHEHHEALAFEPTVTEMFTVGFIARLNPSPVYSPDEWERLISLNHRTLTDVRVSGEAKTTLPHSATSRVKAESQAFQELRTL